MPYGMPRPEQLRPRGYGKGNPLLSLKLALPPEFPPTLSKAKGYDLAKIFQINGQKIMVAEAQRPRIHEKYTLNRT